ncbi:trans-acting transcriptional protein icp0 [Limosa lapponica baueri]|uniref:Trans-acting transcriptional protein icp0 n=1 Tax=Limosa lapponica baueri TaxID=1758121 RepID=A0A2I0U962_LIMLA|nr:trans-acting transcriptional protein icp0 [Limosa lapponica baueri]
MTTASLNFAMCNTHCCGGSKREKLFVFSMLEQGNMATEAEWSCPISRDAQDDVTYVAPCLHQFCRGCTVWWAKQPLCSQTVNTITYSMQSENNILEMVVQCPSDPLVAGHQTKQGSVRPVPRAYVTGFQPEVWASLFWDCLQILQTLLPWLNQMLHGPCWWKVAFTQGTLIVSLCCYGLDEEALVLELQPFLQNQMVTFVHQLIHVLSRDWCSGILQQLDLLDSYATEEGEDSPVATPGPTTSLVGTPTHTPREQEEPHKELVQVAADPSTSGQSRDCSPGWPWCPLKRRANSLPASLAHKKSCLWQH